MSKSRITTPATTSAGIPAPSLEEMQQAPTHPGEIFSEAFRKPSGISSRQAAIRMGVSANHLNEIELGKRAVSFDTAIRMSEMTGTSAEFWATLSMRHELWHALQKAKRRLSPGQAFAAVK